MTQGDVNHKFQRVICDRNVVLRFRRNRHMGMHTVIDMIG